MEKIIMTNCIIPIEHERRFVPDLSCLPFDYSISPVSLIIQGYLEDGLRTRIRDEYDYCTEKHTYTKTRKSGGGISRPEYEQKINKEQFEKTWKEVRILLRKLRYFVVYDGINIQFNVFLEKLTDYFQIEIEFDSNEEAIAFVPPSWLGREVTDNSEHGNYHLAKFGNPKKEENRRGE